MIDIGTYYAIKKGGILDGYGKSRRKPSKWQATPEDQLFDEIKSYGDQIRFDWYEEQIRRKYGGTPTWIHVSYEPVDEEEFRDELENERKRSTLGKLSERQRDVVKRQDGYEPPRKGNSDAITGDVDKSFLGLGVVNSDEKFIGSDGDTTIWRFALIENLFSRYNDYGKFYPSSLTEALERKEEHGSEVVRVFAEYEEIENFDELRNRSDEAVLKEMRNELNKQELESLGI